MSDESVSSDELAEWNENNDEPHPIFNVDHRPERTNLNIDTDDNID